jgi:nicotinamidase-related amidase
MTIDRLANPALIIVDMQNDFVRVGAPMEVPDARTTIRVHQALLTACRANGVPVIYTKFLAGPQSTLIWEWSPALAPPVCACWKGFERYYADIDRTLDCSEIVDELTPAAGDPIVEKYGYGAFHHTNLLHLLQARHVESVVITGTVTQICVEETARESFKHGYPTTIVRDAVSSYLPDLHDAALDNFARKFGWVDPSAAVLEALSARPSIAAGSIRSGLTAQSSHGLIPQRRA